MKLRKNSFMWLGIGGLCFFLLLSSSIPSLMDETNTAPLSAGNSIPAVIPKIESSTGIVNYTEGELAYFIQVSDIHINSEFPDRAARLQQFGEFLNNSVRPVCVISTGDNVDGSSVDNHHQHYQNESEYQTFARIVAESGFSGESWFSILGNHERYHTGQNLSLFSTYIRNETQYARDLVVGNQTYRLIMMDTTQSIGFGNPSSLWGEMTPEKLDEVEQLISTPEATEGLLFFGHAPQNHLFSWQSSSGHTFKQILENEKLLGYYCGHVHQTNLNWNSESMLEMHCPAFRDNSYYRIIAIDQGRMTFRDVNTTTKPLVCITNPIDSTLSSDRLPMESMRTDNQIRVLIFNSTAITNTHLWLDGVDLGTLTHESGNLWSFTYDCSSYASGTHQLKIRAETASEFDEQVINFRLDDFSPASFPGIKHYLLQIPLIPLLISIGLLFFCWGAIQLRKGQKYAQLSEISFSSNRIKRFFQERFSQVAEIPRWLRIWVGVMLLFILIGPYAILPLVYDDLGILTLFGIWFKGILVLEIYSIIVGLLLSLVTLLWLNIFRTIYASNLGSIGKFRFLLDLLLNLAFAGFVVFAVVRYFGLIPLIMTPIFYLFDIIPWLFIGGIINHKMKPQQGS